MSFKHDSIKETFLHFVWQQKKFNFQHLKTTQGLQIRLLQVGQYNTDAGPDFFNAQIEIDGQKWAGNVEMHLRASDWYKHHHETDKAYDNVILHVVWEQDAEVFYADEKPIPTLVLAPYVSRELLDKYTELMQLKPSGILCEKDFAQVDNFVKQHGFENLYLERLEQKTTYIHQLLLQNQNDWEATLFHMLARYFGLKVNAAAFESMAQQTDFGIVRKLSENQEALEALFMGQNHLLDKDIVDPYLQKLRESYAYTQHKFQLDHQNIQRAQFFRLRPPNFPNIRLSQLAGLYAKHAAVFHQLLEAQSLNDFYSIFNVTAAAYWDNHYTFGTLSKPSKKKLSKSFIDIQLINVVFPMRFAYATAQGKNPFEQILAWMQEMAPEKNRYTKLFDDIEHVNKNALISQALLQLSQNYCFKNRCLSCEIGNFLLK
ncbi:MAG: DUF2851 family protein [Bacteroidetes bacterium]|nr:DUF2851 family protein [Bacteroidota bacterium]